MKDTRWFEIKKNEIRNRRENGNENAKRKSNEEWEKR